MDSESLCNPYSTLQYMLDPYIFWATNTLYITFVVNVNEVNILSSINNMSVALVFC